jgi:hypothetical protein
MIIFDSSICLEIVKANFSLLFDSKIVIEIRDETWIVNGYEQSKIYKFWEKSKSELTQDFRNGVFLNDPYGTLVFFLSNFYEVNFALKKPLKDSLKRVTFEDSFFTSLGLSETEAFVDIIISNLSELYGLNNKFSKLVYTSHDIDYLHLPKGLSLLKNIKYSIKEMRFLWILQLLISKLFFINLFSIRILLYINKMLGTTASFFFLTDIQKRVSGGYHADELNKLKNLVSSNMSKFDFGIHYNDDYLSKGIDSDNLSDKFGFRVTTGRAHYLIYDSLRSFGIMKSAGILVDSTLGFHNKIGFRCATSMPFVSWDWHNNTIAAVVELPLVLMDGSLRIPKNRNIFRVYKECIDLLNEINNNKGNLTILWHNTSVIGDGWFKYTIIYILLILKAKKLGFKSLSIKELESEFLNEKNTYNKLYR